MQQQGLQKLRDIHLIMDHIMPCCSTAACSHVAMVNETLFLLLTYSVNTPNSRISYIFSSLILLELTRLHPCLHIPFNSLLPHYSVPTISSFNFRGGITFSM